MVGRTGSVVQYYEVKATYTAVFISLYFYFCLYSYFVYRSSGPLLPFPHIQLIFMSLYFICLHSFLYTDRESFLLFTQYFLYFYIFSFFVYILILSTNQLSRCPPLFTYIFFIFLYLYLVLFCKQIARAASPSSQRVKLNGIISRVLQGKYFNGVYALLPSLGCHLPFLFHAAGLISAALRKCYRYSSPKYSQANIL